MLVNLVTPKHETVIVNTEDISTITDGAVGGFSRIAFISGDKPITVIGTPQEIYDDIMNKMKGDE